MTTPETNVPFRPGLLQRTYLLDSKFQLKYSVIMAIAGALAATACGLLTFLADQRRLEALGVVSEPPADLFWMFGIIAALAAASFGFLGVLITHRVAGPVYVMTRYFSQITQGHYPSVRPLRASDEMRDFFELVQRTIEYLRSREVEEVYRLQDVVTRLSPLATTPESKQAIEALRALAERKRAATERHAPAAAEAAPATSAAPAP